MRVEYATGILLYDGHPTQKHRLLPPLLFTSLLCRLMAPLRGGNKKKMKIEKVEKIEKNDVVHKALSSEDGFADWWAVFSRRIAGSFSPPTDMDMFEGETLESSSLASPPPLRPFLVSA
ncbi:hypothetical protein ACET3Z_019751 [Daucus carota]